MWYVISFAAGVAIGINVCAFLVKIWAVKLSERLK